MIPLNLGFEKYLYFVSAAVGGAFLWQTWRKRVSHSQPRGGLSVREGKVEGETNYFDLTGVPPPKPLPAFDIDNALPRPYRPFRWKYHQTMCT